MEIANILKDWIKKGEFTLTEPVAPLPGVESGIAIKSLEERADRNVLLTEMKIRGGLVFKIPPRPGRKFLEVKAMKRIYLDYAATTPVHPDVLKAMLPYFTDDFGNPSSIHACGQEARGAVEEAQG